MEFKSHGHLGSFGNWRFCCLTGIWHVNHLYFRPGEELKVISWPKKNHIESNQAVWGGKKDLLSAGSVIGFFSWDHVSTFTGLLVLFCLISILQLVKFCLQVADACMFVACGE